MNKFSWYLGSTSDLINKQNLLPVNFAVINKFHIFEIFMTNILSTKFCFIAYLFAYNIFSVKPQISPFDFGTAAVSSGMFVQVTCTAFEGDLPINFNWELNDRLIRDYPDISVSPVGRRSSYLSIDSVSYEHAGNYTCFARNVGGEVFSSTELQVNGDNNVLILINM